MSDFLFTSESVSEGHPDKVADAISDAVLDAVLAQDKHGRVAAETLDATGLVVMAGQITTNASVNYADLARDVSAIAQARRLGAVAPSFIDADAGANPGGYPLGGLTVVRFRNTHLVYALTWFALAGMSAFAAFLLLRKPARR